MEDKNTCWKCDKELSEDDDIINPYDDHTYCIKCNLEQCEEYEKEGYRFNPSNGDVFKMTYYCPVCRTYPRNIVEVFTDTRYLVKKFDEEFGEYEDAGNDEQDEWGAYDIDIPSYEICPICKTKLETID